MKRRYFQAAGVVLLFTALAKLISAGGSAHIMLLTDPILPISFRNVFWLVGVIEIVVAAVCLFGKNVMLQAGLVVWLATNFVFYRFGLIWIGYHRPCSCLGNLTDALHISPQVADTAMKIILAYLLIGSYGILFHQWWKSRKLEAGRSGLGSQSSETVAGS